MTRRDFLASSAVTVLPGAVSAATETTPLALDWSYVADTVMGGVSTGRMTCEEVSERMAARLTGEVSTENDGGFVQIAADLAPEVRPQDWSGLEADVTGNGETYDWRLRTTALTEPWQSFRLSFVAGPGWRTIRAPFTAFQPNRTDAAFAPEELRRMGFLAVGRAFTADLAVAGVRLWR